MDGFKIFSDEDLVASALKVAGDGHTHQDYKHVQAIAKWCKQVNTGDDQKELIIQYRPKESEKQKEKRVRVYNSRTPQVANKVKALFNEVHRTDEINDQIKFDGETEETKEKRSRLEPYLDKFNGLQGARDYLTEKNQWFTFYDPNSWVIVEFEGDGNTRDIYPFEASSSTVKDYKYHRGILQYVTTCIERKYRKADRSEVTNKKFTLYAKDINVDLIEVPEKPEELIDWVAPLGYDIVEYKNSDDKTKTFYQRVFRTQNKYCPALRFGYIKDPATDGRTFISPLHLAEKTLQRLMWRSSTLDVSHACHGFYKMLMYAEKCDHREVIDRSTVYCEGGYIAGGECKKCSGTGKRMHTSDMDVVLFLLDNQKPDKVQPLQNFIHYATIPTELIQEQAKEVDLAITDSLSTIFNENIFDKSVLANTATGIHYNWRSVNNRLLDYANNDEALYKFIVGTVAMIQSLDKGMMVEYGYPSDFKLESIQELLTERSTAVTANAPSEVIMNIDLKILAKQHRDNPTMVQKFKVKEHFRPLRTKRPDEKMIIIEGLSAFHPIKVLDQYFDEIFDQIEDKKPNYHEISLMKMRQVVDAHVEAFIEREKSFLDQLTFNNDGAGGGEGDNLVTPDAVDANAEAQAKLRGTVGGVQGIIGLNQAISQDLMTESTAQKILQEIYGFDEAVASELISKGGQGEAPKK